MYIIRSIRVKIINGKDVKNLLQGKLKLEPFLHTNLLYLERN